jgi:hypothetical protein
MRVAAVGIAIIVLAPRHYADDGLIGPRASRDEAEKDAKETLGNREGKGCSPTSPRRDEARTGPFPRWPRAKRYVLAARALRYVAMSAAFVLIVVISSLCGALLTLVGILWAALHFGVGENDED